MTVVTYNAPNANTQDAATYKNNIDSGFDVVGTNRAAAFAIHERPSPTMHVVVDGGYLKKSGDDAPTLLTGTTLSFTAPTTNPRYDRIYITDTGTFGQIAGTEAASPTIPDLTAANQMSLGYVSLTTTTTSITNNALIDDRVIFRPISISATYTTNTNGNPNISDTQLSVDTLTEASWVEVTSTNWSALSDVPSGADWIEIRCEINGSPASAGTYCDVHVRQKGSTQATGIGNRVVRASGSASEVGNVSTRFKVQLGSSGTFDVYWNEVAANDVSSLYFFLDGYGFNP